MNVVGSTEEHARLEALVSCAIMDTPREATFDNIVFTVAQLFRVPWAMLTLVGEDRIWAKALVGPLRGPWPRETSFCQAVVEENGLLVVEDASTDLRFSQNPSVLGSNRVKFFAGAPLHGPGGHVVGALCVLDHHPKPVQERQRMQFLRLAHEAEELLLLRVPGIDVSV